MVSFYAQHRRKAFRGGATDPDYAAYAARLTGSYTTDQLNAIEAFFAGAKADGIYSIIDVLYIHALANEADGRLNIKGTSFTASRINSMSHAAFQGFTSNGTNSYLNTTFNPSTAGGSFTQNSGSIGLYSRTDQASDNNDMGISNGTQNTTLYTRLASNNAAGRINSSTFDVGSLASNSDSRGFFLATRVSSLAHVLYRNGTELKSTSNTSSAPINASFFVGTRSASGTPTGGFSTRQFALSLIGGGFTPTQASNLNTRVATLMTALGANV